MKKPSIMSIIGWLGAIVMIAFSFTLYVPFALVGLSLLTIQAASQKLHNLVVLNIISIAGFAMNYWS